MGFLLGKQCRVFLAGYDFSGNLTGYDAEGTTEALDNTTFGTSYHKTQQPGLLSAKISLKGFSTYTISPDVTGYLNTLISRLRTDTPGLQVLPASGTTPAAGDAADLWVSTHIDRKIGVAVDQIITLDAEIAAKHGLHMGDVLHALTALSGSPFTTTGYDQGGAAWVAATYRWLVEVQVTAYTSGLAALKVQTSPNNSTWTTRGTFPAITALGGYWLELNATLDRYVRITDTGVATIISAVALQH